MEQSSTDFSNLHTHEDALAALISFLRDFESFQEQVDLRRVGAAQSMLRARTAGLFPAIASALAALAIVVTQEALVELRNGIAHLERAVHRILGGEGPSFVQAFIESRQDLQRALTLLYGVRRSFPTLQACFASPEALPHLDALDTQTADCTVPTGLMTMPETAAHNLYSLYVPESYSPSREWPLIVCLHGGYGHANEYLWTWFKLARSQRCLLLSPKSIGPTWSILNPQLDIESIHAMLDEVCATWRIDTARVFLSGLSDGGTFSYLLGLASGSTFRGVAPIAGVLPELADQLLRRKQGIDIPLFIVHGAQDFIFDVRGVRSTTALLEQLGYRVHYTELPEWGHAFPYSINETLILPWFLGLGPPP